VRGWGGAHSGPFGPGQGIGVHGIGGPGAGGFAGPGVMGTGGEAGNGRQGVGVYGRGDPAVFGFSTTVGVDGFGVVTGVSGEALTSGGVGVRGRCDGDGAFGVVGAARAGSGVAGRGRTGVVGVTPDQPGGAIGAGVVGTAAGPGTGVRGETSNGTGVDGYSITGTGVAGRGGHMGVYAEAVGGGNPVWLGTPDLAGDFHGGVLVRGDLTVLGDKAAAVPLPDGTLGRLYALEAPESWFEDFGSGALTGGAAAVALDRDFAAVVRPDPEGYRVFLTPRGDCNGLYVSQQGPAGFEVRELRGGTSGVAFDYRVVARRKDRPGPRLERVAPPRRPAPDRPTLPAVEVPDVEVPDLQPPVLPERPPRPKAPGRSGPPAR
jgi:hypothetical protein